MAGTVTDSEGLPIQGVVVTLAELNRQSISDDLGEYRINRVPPGRYLVTFGRLGYASQTVEHVEVLDGRVTSVDIILNRRAIEVASVTVSAAARPSNLLTAAPDLSIVSGREKTSREQSNLGASLEHLPGVANIATGKQVGKPVIRGLSSNRIRVLQDGIAMDYQQYGVRHWANVDPYLAERVEVVRGASSVLYGSDAIGGVVNVIPRTIPQAIGTSAMVRGTVLGEYSANNNEAAGGVTLEGAVGGFGITGSLVRRSAGNFTTPDAPTAGETGNGTDPQFTGVLDNTDYDQLSGSVGMGYQGAFGMLGAHYTGWRDEHNFLLPSGGGVGQNLENDILQGKAVLVLRNGWVLRPTLNYLRNLRQSNPGGATRDQLPNDVVIDIELQSYTGRVALEHPYLGSFTGQLGVEYNSHDQNSRGQSPLVPSGRIRNFAAFLYEEANLGRLSLSLGGRFDYRSQTADPDERIQLPDYEGGETDDVLEQTYSVATGSLGAAYRATDHLTLAANVGRGFRAPGMFDLHAYGVHGGVASFQIGDPNLNREASISTDFSVRWQSPGVQASVTGYLNSFDDYIYLINSETVDSASGLPIMRAVQGDARLWGADASVQAQVLPWLQLRGVVRTVTGENTDTEQDLPLLPATAFEGEVKFATRSLSFLENPYVTLGFRAVADKAAAGRYEPFWQFDNNPNFGVASTDAYSLFHAGLGFDLMLAGNAATVDVLARNLFDEAYRDFLDTYKGYALSPGRDVSVRVRVPFGMR